MSDKTQIPPHPSDTDGQLEQELKPAEILGWLEFACWTMLLLAPVLYYVNGPSVSIDQLVVRTALVVLAGLGAIALRLINWQRSRRDEKEND